MIEVNGVTKTFGSNGSALQAVDNAHFSVNPGEFILILGRSGSGKSTLLGMLSGLIRPTSGSILVNGMDISTLTDDRLSEIRAKEIGFIFQFSGLIPTVTAIENVMIPTLFCPSGTDPRSRAAELLKKVGMEDRMDAFPSTLSSGEMKRVAIARALMNGPSLLLADEPTGDLDVDTEIEIMELFKQLHSEGLTVVMVTHNPDLECYATRTCGMDRGKLVPSTELFCQKKWVPVQDSLEKKGLS
jgi:ABC-type lipoprotein export system ATPase subunit